MKKPFIIRFALVLLSIVLAVISFNTGKVITTNTFAPIVDERNVLALERSLLTDERDVLVEERESLVMEVAIHKDQSEELASEAGQLSALVDTAMLSQIEEITFGKEFSVGSFVVSAYSPYDDRNGINSYGDPSKTSIGATTRPGTFAVDPSVIPYRSNVLVIYPDGTIEHGRAEDTGGAIKGNRLDVFRYSFDNAMSFGMRDAVVIWYAN